MTAATASVAAEPKTRRRFAGPVSVVLQVVIAIAVFAVGSVLVPGFGQPSSVKAMAVLASFLGIAALGQTMVVLIGGIDLSVPALIGAGNVMAAKLTGDGVPWILTLLLVLLVGVVAGAINGYITHRWTVPPLVVTLAMSSVVGGLVLLWTNARLTGSAPPEHAEIDVPEVGRVEHPRHRQHSLADVENQYRQSERFTLGAQRVGSAQS